MATQNIPLSDAIEVVFDGKPVSEVVLNGKSIWIKPLPQSTPTPTELTFWSDFRDDDGLPKIVFLKNATNYRYHKFHLPAVLYHNGWTSNSYPKYTNIPRSNGITPDIIVDIEYDDSYGWVIWYRLFDYNEWSWTSWDYTSHYSFSSSKDLTTITEWENSPNLTNWSNIKFSCEPEDFTEYITEFGLYHVLKNNSQQLIQPNNLSFKTVFSNLGFPTNIESEITSEDFVYLHNLEYDYTGGSACDSTLQKLTFNETFHNGGLDILYNGNESTVTIPHNYNTENFCTGNYDHTNPGKLMVFKNVREDYETTAYGDQWREKKAIVTVSNKTEPIYPVDEDFGVTDDKIQIAWDAVEDTVSYEVRISETNKLGQTETNSIQTSIDNVLSHNFTDLSFGYYKIVVISNIEINNPEDGFTWQRSIESSPIVVKVDFLIYPPNGFALRSDFGSPKNPWLNWNEHPKSTGDYMKYRIILRGDTMVDAIEVVSLFSYYYFSDSELMKLIDEPSLPADSYTAYLVAFDAYGNESDAQTLSYVVVDAPTPTPDISPPSAPTFSTQPNSPDNDTTPTWSWNEVSDSSEVFYRYGLWKTGSQIGSWSDWESSLSYTPPGLTDGTYQLKIQCKDDANNQSNITTSSSYVLDTTEPGIPRPNTNTPTNNNRPTWSWSKISDAVKYEVLFQNNVHETILEHFSIGLNNNLSDGSHTIQVRAIDSAGNYSDYGSHTVVIDTTPLVGVPVPSTQTPTNDTTPTWTWSAIQDAIKYDIKLNSVSMGQYSDTQFTSISLSDGSHTIEVATIDSAGNIGNYGSHTAVIKTSAPSGGTPDPSTKTPTNNRKPTWTWSAITEATQYAVRLSSSSGPGQEQIITTNSYTPSSNLSEGFYTIFVRAMDSLGNSTASGSHSAQIDFSPITILPVPNTTTPTNNKRPTWTWSQVPGASLYGVKLGNSAEITTTSRNYTPSSDLSSGSYTLYVRVQDSAGNWGEYASHVVTIDLVAPDKPFVYGPTPINNPKPTWSWNAISGAVSYKIKLNGTVIASVGSLIRSYTPTQNLSNASHTLQVIAVDSAGNESQPGIHVITVDTVTPGVPDVSGITPTNNLKPNWSWTAISGAVDYGVKLNDGNEFFTTSRTYTPSSNLSDGLYMLYVRARDAAGNVSNYGQHLIQIDTVSPPKPAFIRDQGTGAHFYSSRRPKIRWSLVLDAGCTGDGCVTYETSLDWFETWEETQDTDWTPSINLVDGFYNLCVRSKDKTGNVSEYEVFGFWVDNVAPEPPEFSGNGFSNDSQPRFFWISGPNTDFWECKVNNGSTFTSTRRNYTTEDDFPHGALVSMQVRACDNAGNVSVWVSHTITVDLESPTDPVISVISPTNNTRPTWSWTTSADAVSYGIKLGNSPWVSETIIDETSYTSENELSEGTHTLYVRAKDTAGNWSNTTSKSVVIDIAPPDTTTSRIFILSEDEYNFKPTIYWYIIQGVANYQVKINNGSWITVPSTKYEVVTPVGLGLNGVWVRGVDSAGNIGPSKGSSWTTKAVSSPQIGDLDCLDKVGNTWEFDWNSATGAIEYEYRLNNSTPIQTLNTEYEFENLSAGNYTAEVRSHGGGGNYSDWNSLQFEMKTQINILSKNPMIMPVSVESGDTSIAIDVYKHDKCSGAFGIDWGDGVYEEESSGNWSGGRKSHTYPSSGGNYNIKVYAAPNTLRLCNPDTLYNSDFKVKGVSSWGDLELTSLYGQFSGGDVENMVIPTSIPSSVRSLEACFKDVVYPSGTYSWNYTTKTNYRVFDAISSWDVSNVTDLGWMFYGNEFFNSNLNNWNVSNCIDLALVFEGCEVYDQPMNNWNINSTNEVTMYGMFKNAKRFNQSIGNWNVSNVTRMDFTFYNAEKFNQNLANWNTGSVTTMDSMFAYAEDFNNGFYTSSSNSIAIWNVSSCRDFDQMFYDTIIDIDLSTWCVEDAPFPYGFATLSPLEDDYLRWPNFGNPC